MRRRLGKGKGRPERGKRARTSFDLYDHPVASGAKKRRLIPKRGKKKKDKDFNGKGADAQTTRSKGEKKSFIKRARD